MEYKDHVPILETAEPELAAAVASFQSLENVLSWMKDQGFQLSSLDLMTQDEFSHDLLIPWQESKYLVFGVT